ncbi:uncharacterized protein LOC125501894 [Athalia rosae]|uniref:uncharacterized protein LOC125501894 n=1 Tax=Athalia rosae TaxID=37344 RepID=UPI0020337F13|nr:uncharacterized protein LOC125501894 [Athalia rosae]
MERVGNPTQDQKNMLVHFLQQHPELVSGKFNKDFTYKMGQNLWKEVAQDMNAIPGAKKDWMQWRKCWQDMQSHAKKKKASNMRNACKTGGGPSETQTLTPLEDSVVDLVGPTSIIGDTTVNESETTFVPTLDDSYLILLSFLNRNSGKDIYAVKKFWLIESSFSTKRIKYLIFVIENCPISLNYQNLYYITEFYVINIHTDFGSLQVFDCTAPSDQIDESSNYAHEEWNDINHNNVAHDEVYRKQLVTSVLQKRICQPTAREQGSTSTHIGTNVAVGCSSISMDDNIEYIAPKRKVSEAKQPPVKKLNTSMRDKDNNHSASPASRPVFSRSRPISAARRLTEVTNYTKNLSCISEKDLEVRKNYYDSKLKIRKDYHDAKLKLLKLDVAAKQRIAIAIENLKQDIQKSTQEDAQNMQGSMQEDTQGIQDIMQEDQQDMQKEYLEEYLE